MRRECPVRSTFVKWLQFPSPCIVGVWCVGGGVVGGARASRPGCLFGCGLSWRLSPIPSRVQFLEASGGKADRVASSCWCRHAAQRGTTSSQHRLVESLPSLFPGMISASRKVNLGLGLAGRDDHCVLEVQGEKAVGKRDRAVARGSQATARQGKIERRTVTARARRGSFSKVAKAARSDKQRAWATLVTLTRSRGNGDECADLAGREVKRIEELAQAPESGK